MLNKKTTYKGHTIKWTTYGYEVRIEMDTIDGAKEFIDSTFEEIDKESSPYLKMDKEESPIHAVVCSRGEIPKDYSKLPLLNEGFSYDVAHRLGLSGEINVYDVALGATRCVNIGKQDHGINGIARHKDVQKLQQQVKALEAKVEECK